MNLLEIVTVTAIAGTLSAMAIPTLSTVNSRQPIKASTASIAQLLNTTNLIARANAGKMQIIRYDATDRKIKVSTSHAGTCTALSTGNLARPNSDYVLPATVELTGLSNSEIMCMDSRGNIQGVSSFSVASEGKSTTFSVSMVGDVSTEKVNW